MSEPLSNSNPDLPVLALNGISKTFPGVRALSGVSLELYSGQVTALVGENGAGKTTVVKILTGIYQPDAGAITIDGETVSFNNPHAASINGITAIHQETVMFDNLSVAENIFIGHAPKNRFGFIQKSKMHSDAKDLLQRIGADLDSRTELKDLGIASKHVVGIARALSIDARVVIMDEPTAALGVHETAMVAELIGELKKQGLGIFLISHDTREMMELCDRVSVMKNGQMVGTERVEDVTEDDILSMIILGKNPKVAA